jgi:NADH:ubiquinone oxidoreductase subunit D
MTTIQQEPELETVDLNINMGPQHPSTHGVFRMVLTVDGERIVDVEPHIGYMHRGGEKLCENMDYRQGIGYMDRTEYLGQLNAELAYCIAAERLGGLEVPEHVCLPGAREHPGPARRGLRRPDHVQLLPSRRACVGRHG